MLKCIKVCKNVLLQNDRYKVRNINNRYEYMVLSQRYTGLFKMIVRGFNDLSYAIHLR